MLARFLFFGFLTITPVAILSDLPDRGIPGLFEQGGGGCLNRGEGVVWGKQLLLFLPWWWWWWWWWLPQRSQPKKKSWRGVGGEGAAPPPRRRCLCCARHLLATCCWWCCCNGEGAAPRKCSNCPKALPPCSYLATLRCPSAVLCPHVPTCPHAYNQTVCPCAPPPSLFQTTPPPL